MLYHNGPIMSGAAGRLLHLVRLLDGQLRQLREARRTSGLIIDSRLTIGGSPYFK
jgi:hypothetical protein